MHLVSSCRRMLILPKMMKVGPTALLTSISMTFLQTLVPEMSLLKRNQAEKAVQVVLAPLMTSDLKRLASLLTTHHLILNEEKDHESFVYRKQPFRWHLIF